MIDNILDVEFEGILKGDVPWGSVVIFGEVEDAEATVVVLVFLQGEEVHDDVSVTCPRNNPERSHYRWSGFSRRLVGVSDCNELTDLVDDLRVVGIGKEILVGISCLILLGGLEETDLCPDDIRCDVLS